MALHSSDPATVYLSVWARVTDFDPADMARALSEDKDLIGILGMRRTMWVVPTDFAPVVHSSSTAALAVPQRRRLTKMLEEGGVTTDGRAWLDNVSSETLAALDRLGHPTARELSAEVPELAEKITLHKGDGSLMGHFGASTRVLFQLATEGLAVRAKPLGSWLSSQYRWSTIENWIGAPLDVLDRELAQDRLLGHWLKVFGPATETDIKWWTGWPVTNVRASLQRIEAVEVELEDGVGHVWPDDEEPVDPLAPHAVLLPSLDPTTMGWKQRDWYMGEHSPRLFDRNGNAGPTIWFDGRVVGGWAQRADGRIAYEIFDDVGAEGKQAIEDRALEVQEWLGEITVTARFRSPHDKELTSS